MGRKKKATMSVGCSSGIVKRTNYKDDTDTDDDFEVVPYRARTKRAASPSSGSEPEVVVKQRRIGALSLLKGWTSEALRLQQRAELEKNGFGFGFVDKHFLVEESYRIGESPHGNDRVVPTLCGGQGNSRAGLTEPELYMHNLIKAAKQVADAMSGLMIMLLDAPMHIRQAPIFNNVVQATSALIGVKCKKDTAQSADVVGYSQTLLGEVWGTMESENDIVRMMEVIDERERLEDCLGYPSFSLGITQEANFTRPVISQFEKEEVMVEVEDSKSAAEMEDLGSPIYILGQEGEVAPWLEKGNDQTPRDVPPLDGTTNVPDFGSVSEGLAPATVRGERLPFTNVPQADHPAPEFDNVEGAYIDIASVVKNLTVEHFLDEPGVTKLEGKQTGEKSLEPPDVCGAQIMEVERTDFGEVQNKVVGIDETVDDIVKVLNMYPAMLGETKCVEGNQISQATVIANAPGAPLVLDKEEEYDDEPVGALLKVEGQGEGN